MSTSPDWAVDAHDYPNGVISDYKMTVATGLTQYEAIALAVGRNEEHQTLHQLRTKARTRRGEVPDMEEEARKAGVRCFESSCYNVKNRFPVRIFLTRCYGY